jgi:succinyl-CoA synthetase alpha subunit
MPVSAPSLHSDRPNLRLVHDEGRSILIAGGDPERRSALVQELSQRLPAGTCFEQVDATWEMLERAPSSRMVMLAGELDGSSPESAMHLLGSRHPRLPVVALGEAVASQA